MTKAVAVLLADGCEEIEALTVVDVLRRLAIPVETVALGDQLVTGGHGIKIQADTTWHDQLTAAPLVVLPGGRGGAERLRDDGRVGEVLRARQANGQWNAAICAGPIALARHGVLADADFTCFPGVETEIAPAVPSARFHDQLVVKDEPHHLLTSRGPATAMAFAYAIAELLGVDAQPQRTAMLYDYLLED